MSRKIKAHASGYVYSRWKKVENGTGTSSVPDGTRVVDFEVELDVEKLIRAKGKQAAFNKKGVTKLQGGAIILRVVRQRDEA